MKFIWNALVRNSAAATDKRCKVNWETERIGGPRVRSDYQLSLGVL